MAETTIYKCPICNATDENLEYLIKHVNDHDHEEKQLNPNSDVADMEYFDQATPTLDTQESKDKMAIWSSQDTKLLISLVEEFYEEFNTNLKKNVWTKICARIVKETNKSITYQQCDTKFESLKKQYKKIKDHNNKSGNSRKTWEYFEGMDNLLKNKPEVEPVATCSSENGIKISDHVSENDEEDRDINNENLNKRKRKYSESPAERRHREKMMRQDKFLNIMAKMLEKM